MKYQLITYTTPQDVVVENTDDVNVFDRYASAVSAGKHATLNERQQDGSYATIKLKFGSRVINKKEKPTE